MSKGRHNLEKGYKMDSTKIKILMVTILTILALSIATVSHADEGEVVKTFSGCDYFIADGQSGYYVLEWFGGYDPDEGDSITGDIGSYGTKDVIYNNSRSGKVWVEDFLESWSGAMEEINDHC